MISVSVTGGHTRRVGAHPARAGTAATWLGRCVVALVLAFVAGGPVAAAQAGATRSTMRDFPPLINPERPRAATAPPEGVPILPDTLRTSSPVGLPEQAPLPYHLGVGDQLQVSVLGEPDYTRNVVVLPNGSITTPAAGTIFVLGRTPDEVSREIERKLDQFLRHPRVDVIVNTPMPRMVYVMGEVPAAGERPYRPGLTALQAIAQAGGIRTIGKANSVLVMRRTGRDDAVFYRIDVTEALKGKGKGEDMFLEPYDIVFVPHTFIGSIGIFIDQYLRPALVPFNLYLQGWDAFNINNNNVRLSGGR